MGSPDKVKKVKKEKKEKKEKKAKKQAEETVAAEAEVAAPAAEPAAEAPAGKLSLCAIAKPLADDKLSKKVRPQACISGIAAAPWQASSCLATP